MPAKESKVLFSDILGAMVSGIAQARQIADINAVNLAYYYQRNDLLKGMAVPRLRFRNIEVSLPVLIHQVRGRKPLELDQARNIADVTVEEICRKAKLMNEKLLFDIKGKESDQKTNNIRDIANFWKNISAESAKNTISQCIERQLDKEVHQYLRRSSPDASTVSEPAIRSGVEKAVRVGMKIAVYNLLERDRSSEKDPHEFYNELRSEPHYEKIISAAMQIASDKCFKTPAAPAELEVVVATDDIKNKGGAESLTRIKFILHEEGLEWVNDENGSGKRLVAE